MDFFLKEAVHQRAFCSYIVFLYRGKYCTTLFFFSFSKQHLGGTASTHTCGAIAHLQRGAEGMAIGVSTPQVVHSTNRKARANLEFSTAVRGPCPEFLMILL